MRSLYILLFLSCFASDSYSQYCSGTTILTDCSGEFDDGSGNSNYANNSDCSWLIQVPEDSTILLIFNSFSTESCCDELNIYNGSSANAPHIGEYKGNSLPDIIQSNSNELFLEFTTDGSVTSDGWSVSYFCNDTSFIDLTYEDPGFSDLLNANGSILEYDFNLRNEGNLISGPFEVVFYASEDLNIDTSDPVMFTESIDTLYANSSVQLTGIRDVRDSIPSGNYINVGFIIDPKNEVSELIESNNAFQENYEGIYIPYCSELTTITGCQGMIDDGSGLDDVVRESQCSWLILSDNDESIYLDFFDVELNSSASISIYDGEDQNAPLIQEFKGDDDFYPVVSTGNSIYFEFDVSYSGGDGWNAEYSCTDTGIANMIMELSSNANSTGSTVEFDLELRNNGNITSPSSKIYFFGSVDNEYNRNEDYILDSVELPSIPALGTMQISHSLDAKGKLPSGGYFPVAVIDAYNKVVELNEEDNLETFSDRFYIPYCTDTTKLLDGCAGIFTDGSGNQNFTPDSDCSWLIKADSGQYVSLSVLSADLGSSSNSLRFYDGEDNFSQLMAEFTGGSEDDIPSSILSTGENVYVEFVSSSYLSVGSGWDFQYDCIEDIEVNLDFIEDYQLVRVYNNEVQYKITVRNFGNRISPETKIYFFLSPDLNINSNDIIVDSIVLPPIQPYRSILIDRDINPRLIDPVIPGGRYYPGFSIDPLDEVVETNEDDNSFIQSRIIELPYCYEETQLTGDCDGVISDGSGGNNYVDDSDCTWLIEAPMNSNIRLTFTEFNTESCCDYVRVYDGNSRNAPLLGTFSGSTLPPGIETTQNRAYITFDTDGSSSRSGWELEYECIEFFSNLKFKNGSTQFQVINNSLNLATIIENDGDLPTGEFKMGIILSEDEKPNIGDFILASETFNNLEPGEEVEYESEFDLSNVNVPSGEYYLIVRLDLEEDIEENDEMDNDFISAFPIDIISSIHDKFSDSGINIFLLNKDILIKNDLQLHLKRVSIIKADGVVLLDQKISHSNSDLQLDVINYPAGLYFVRLELEDQILVKKLVIPR